jgi:hypothetical protein
MNHLDPDEDDTMSVAEVEQYCARLSDDGLDTWSRAIEEEFWKRSYLLALRTVEYARCRTCGQTHQPEAGCPS